MGLAIPMGLANILGFCQARGDGSTGFRVYGARSTARLEPHTANREP